MREIIGNNVLYNGKIMPADQIISIFNEGFSVYEVIRVEQGIAIFLEAHLKRLFHTLQLEQLEISEPAGEIREYLHQLLDSNPFHKGKVKLVFHYPGNENQRRYNFLFYFTDFAFPVEKQYMTGVRIGLCKAVRTDPNAKVLNTEARRIADQKISETGLFEVLLMDEEGYITEGSRSNIFFLKDRVLYTPPDENVLKGIARQNVLAICREQDISVEIRPIHSSELPGFEASFLTGTSLKVLPVRQIEDFSYKVNEPLLRSLRFSYNQKIREYIREQTSG